MKNSIYSFFCIAIIALATSCQKEELLPNNVDQPVDQPAVQAYFNATPPPSNAWYLCGEYFKAVVKYPLGGTTTNPFPGPTLTISGDGVVLPETSFKLIDKSQMPPAVLAAMDAMGFNMQPDAMWQSFDPTFKFILIEYVHPNFTEIQLFDITGSHLCKGYHN